MKQTPLKCLVVILVFMMFATMACSLGTPKVTEAPKPTEVEAAQATPTKEPVPVIQNTVETNAVSSLDSVKGATIQIEAQGTFVDPEVGLVVNGAGRGSGFIIDPSGIAVTNNHVVTGSALLKVWVGGDKGKVYSAKVLGASECSDLAVIQIEGSGFPYMQWHEGQPKVGLEIYAAGYPLGDPEYTLTKGIVSKSNADGKTSWASIGSVLEHDARINPGNSGGPLVDKDGRVVGINYASNSNNQYFAIARAEADDVLGKLKAGADLNSIGVNGQAVMSDDGSLSGVWVSSVKSGSPADKSGVEPGDIITQMEGLALATDGTMDDYCHILRSHKPTDTLSLTILRWKSKEILEGQLNGRELKVTATFESGGQSNTSGTPDSNSGNATAKVADDANVITMEVPTGWEYDGSAWESTWSIGSGSYPFTAQTLLASPNAQAYSKGWDTTGIFIATSSDWGNIGGYANLLEGVRDLYKDCRSNGQQKYKGDEFEGLIQLYNKCGPNKTNALVMAVRPVQNPQAYLVLVEMKYTTEDELNVLDAILTTANINP